MLVADLSFIGLAQLAGVFAGLSRPGSVFLGLVKPQFESRHDETDHGVVRDPEVRQRTVDEVSAALEAAGFSVEGVVESPITGRKATWSTWSRRCTQASARGFAHGAPAAGVRPRPRARRCPDACAILCVL